MTLLRENVQEYPRPPAVEQVSHRLIVRLGSETVADTISGWRVLETHHAPTYYLPRSDIAPGILTSAPGRSFCEWKGWATYFDVTANGQALTRAAWSYLLPSKHFTQIADHVAFYAGTLDCFVGDVAVIPQPGDFYGGWVTPNLDGIVKGSAGTEGW